MENKKILIISHNIIDSSNNVGKTVISLIKKWPSDLTYSIYLRSEVRETMHCYESFRITDKDILKNSLVLSPNNCGSIIKREDTKKTENNNAYAYRVGNKRFPIISLTRDILWHKKSWGTKSFKEWILKISPDLILFVPNDYTLAFEIAEYVKDLTHSPMITFFTDDSFYYGYKTGVIDSLRRKWLLKLGRKIVSKSEGIICASTLMQREYKSIFGRESEVFGNCVELSSPLPSTKKDKNTFVFSYVGNLHSNRWQSLLDIGKCLDIMNSVSNVHYSIDVYSASDLGESILNKLKSVDSITMKGAIPPSKVKIIQELSDALVHIEAFDYKSKLSTRLSMSTKIFEYMARNVPIFAYGPEDISSISFLQDHDFACVCTSDTKLHERLNQFVNNDSMRNSIRAKSYDYAKDNFEEEKISSDFIKYAEEIVASNR